MNADGFPQVGNRIRVGSFNGNVLIVVQVAPGGRESVLAVRPKETGSREPADEAPREIPLSAITWESNVP